MRHSPEAPGAQQSSFSFYRIHRKPVSLRHVRAGLKQRNIDARALVAAAGAVGLSLLESLALCCASLPVLSFLLQTWYWTASCILIGALLALLLITRRALLRSSGTLCSRAVCWSVTLRPRLGLCRGRSYLTVR